MARSSAIIFGPAHCVFEFDTHGLESSFTSLLGREMEIIKKQQKRKKLHAIKPNELLTCRRHTYK